MGKLARLISFSILFVLAIILFVLLLPNLASQEKKEIFHVSVIINDSNDDYWKNFRKGMERAAVDYNVDVRFVMLLDGETADAQQNSIQSEIEKGTDAVVISAVDGKSLALWLKTIPRQIPVVAVGDDVPSEKISVELGPDWYAMGRELADKIHSTAAPGHCLVYVAENNRDPAQKSLQGLEDGLAQYGISYAEKHVNDGVPYESQEGGVLAAVEEPVLEELIKNAPEKAGIYGIGYTNKILDALSEGRVKALIVQSDYAEGYLSIQSAVNEIEGIKQPESITLRHYCADMENMYQKPLEQILFP